MRPGQDKRLPNHVIGLIMIVLIAVGSFLAYTKKLPWSHGYEIKAVFTTAENVRVKSPVRIAGVDVGEVTEVEHLTSDDPDYQAAAGQSAKRLAQYPPSGQQAAAVVTMQINDEGLPIHEDATFKLRPRLFLEGNLFVDLHPGSPGAPEAADGHLFPVTQSSVAVQLDQVLTTLQGDVRKNLQVFLQEFGDALIKYHGAEGFRQLYATSPGAYRYTSQVNQAFLGTQPHDLSGLVKNLDSTVQALDADEAGLQNLVTNLRVVTGSFAAHDRALGAAIAELPRTLAVGRPALLHLSDSFPPLRAFAREILPGVRSSPETLDAATPLLRQVRGLVSKPELRGLVHDLRPTIPRLTKLTKRTIPFLRTSRALSSCFNQVVIPWSNDSIGPSDDPEFPAPNGAKVFEETGYGLVGIAGESRSGDANGEYIRVEAGGGTNTLIPPGNGTGSIVTGNPASQTVPFVGFVENTLQGARPAVPPGENDGSDPAYPAGISSAKPPFRPDAPCERQAPPNLDSGDLGDAPDQTPVSSASSALSAPLRELSGESLAYAKQYQKAQELGQAGKTAQAAAVMKRATVRWQRFKKARAPQLRTEAQSSGSGNR
jgi:phospholipid/cholesterol/gamma-HCH transport system substrate-binding protein